MQTLMLRKFAWKKKSPTAYVKRNFKQMCPYWLDVKDVYSGIVQNV